MDGKESDKSQTVVADPSIEFVAGQNKAGKAEQPTFTCLSVLKYILILIMFVTGAIFLMGTIIIIYRAQESSNNDIVQGEENKPNCTYAAELKYDVNFPENTEVKPSSEITKSWVLKNTGTCEWEDNVKLVYVTGTGSNNELSQSIKPLDFGESTIVSITLILPSTIGNYESTWQLQADDKDKFGDLMYIKLNLTPTAIDTPN